MCEADYKRVKTEIVCPMTPPDCCPFCDYAWSAPWHTPTLCGFNSADDSMKKIYNLELSLSEAKGREAEAVKMVEILWENFNKKCVPVWEVDGIFTSYRNYKLNRTAKPGEGK